MVGGGEDDLRSRGTVSGRENAKEKVSGLSEEKRKTR